VLLLFLASKKKNKIKSKSAAGMEEWLDTVSMDLLFLNICTHILGHTVQECRESKQQIHKTWKCCVRAYGTCEAGSRSRARRERSDSGVAEGLKYLPGCQSGFTELLKTPYPIKFLPCRDARSINGEVARA
jgi:hypothetical protein